VFVERDAAAQGGQEDADSHGSLHAISLRSEGKKGTRIFCARHPSGRSGKRSASLFCPSRIRQRSFASGSPWIYSTKQRLELSTNPEELTHVVRSMVAAFSAGGGAAPVCAPGGAADAAAQGAVHVAAACREERCPPA